MNQTGDTEHLRSTAAGIFRHRLNKIDLPVPVALLKYPVKNGEEWLTPFASETGQVNMASKVSLEKVTVPAGTFDAALVTSEFKTPESTMTSRQWFAPGVGLVKHIVVDPNGTTFELRLKKFEPSE
jgi:hypothetical protein